MISATTHGMLTIKAQTLIKRLRAMRLTWMPHGNRANPADEAVFILSAAARIPAIATLPAAQSLRRTVPGVGHVYPGMNTLWITFGWMFVTLAAIYALGVAEPLARRFYPGSPGFLARLAAPLIFAVLAAACFLHVAVPALIVTVALGTVQIARSRWLRRRTRG